MRLLERDDNGEFRLTKDIANNIPPYAILSHTWGNDEEEVTFQEMMARSGKSKAGYQKIQFCGDQAARDDLRYSWIDTCCINKSDAAELQNSINSMFRWYRNAVKCYVYLADVSMLGERVTCQTTANLDLEVESAFRSARWFNRGWTLQELLAPISVEFYSMEGRQIGDRSSLEHLIHEITGLPIRALQGYDAAEFGVEERISWVDNRETTYEEDMAYSLFGIFDVFLPVIYGEGKEHALWRLREEVKRRFQGRGLGDFSERDMKSSPEAQHDHKGLMDQLLRSLRDEDMTTRVNQIEAHHEKTFAWVFDTEAQRPWDSFPDWLSCRDKIYWIVGKPGSGKSTLMKFLLGADQTMEYLNRGAPDHVIYSHFIWNSGSHIQRSIAGFLRSLIYQIFDRNHHIMEDAIQRWGSTMATNNWSRQLLELVLLRSLALHQQPVCIFLDGLDEIDHEEGSSDLKGPYHLLRFIQEDMVSCSDNTIKICVSSRPEPAFRSGLGKYPKLQVQDLTKRDVDAYARDFVQSRCSFQFINASENLFIEEVVAKADGVFLWVSLALQSLQKGIVNGDRPEELMDRLRRLSPKVEELYQNMFARLGEDRDVYLSTAATYFNIFIDAVDVIQAARSMGYNIGHFNLLRYAVACEPSLYNVILELRNLGDLPAILLDFDRRLNSRCAGVLEVVSRSESERHTGKLLLRDIKRPWSEVSIQFVHRSAREFLLNTRGKILEHDRTSKSQRLFRILQAIVLDEFYRHDEEDKRSRDEMMAYMSAMADPELLLSQEQELALLSLAQTVYNGKNRPGFYENAASYGLHRCHTLIIRDGYQDSSALRNYLLLCTSTASTLRTYTMLLYLLNIGADPNWLGLIPADINGHRIHFPTPLLGFKSTILAWENFGRLVSEDYKVFKDLLQVMLTFGADPTRKFLSYECVDQWIGVRKYAGTARPIELSYENTSPFVLLVERNCIDAIVQASKNMGGTRRRDAYGRSSRTLLAEIASIFGLNIAEAYRKVILYVDKGVVYETDDEDSKSINRITGWPERRVTDIPPKRWLRIRTQICGLLKGKEVTDLYQWLTDRGHMVVKETGITPEASVSEMAEIYQKLNERFRPELSTEK